MDVNQPAVPPPPAATSPAPGVFGTKIPASVAFVLGILLFLLPLTEIRCGNTALANKSGIAYATGGDWKASGGYGKETMGEMTSKSTGDKEGSAQIFAIAALALGVIGLVITFMGSRSGASVGIITGALAAGAMIGLMFEIKKWFNALLAREAAEKAGDGAGSLGFDQIGKSMSPTLAFTPWFYVSVVAFLAAAFFCYKRLKSPS